LVVKLHQRQLMRPRELDKLTHADQQALMTEEVQIEPTALNHAAKNKENSAGWVTLSVFRNQQLTDLDSVRHVVVDVQQ
jgi:hypothetical protein